MLMFVKETVTYMRYFWVQISKKKSTFRPSTKFLKSPGNISRTFTKSVQMTSFIDNINPISVKNRSCFVIQLMQARIDYIKYKTAIIFYLTYL